MARCSHRTPEGLSTYEPSKRGKFEVCSKCNDRFPCSDHSCAHYDCRPERGQQARCYYCEGQLPAEGRNDTWTVVTKRGGDVTAHFCCRDAHTHTPRSDLVTRARGPEPYYPETCPHTFADKAPIDLGLLKTMAEAKRAV